MKLQVTLNTAYRTPYSRAPIGFIAAAAALLALSQGVAAQEAPPPQPAYMPDWQVAAGGHMAFDLISIHPEKNPDADSGVNVPYGGEDTYTDTGGVFRATNWPVFRLMGFAFKGTHNAFHDTCPIGP